MTLADFAPAGVHTRQIAARYGIITGHLPDGSLAASAMQDRAGWMVSLAKATCLIYVEDETEARSLLAAVVRCLSPQSPVEQAEAALPLNDRSDAES